MCPIQKGFRPRFSAFPNKAPFQLDSRKAGSRSSSQERPFLGPQLIKPRCVWAPRLCQAWNLSLHSLAGGCQSSVLPAKPLESSGPVRMWEVSNYCCRKEGGCPTWHSPCSVSPWATTGIIGVQDHITKHSPISLPPLRDTDAIASFPWPPHLSPGFASLLPPPHALLSQISFSADFPPKALQFFPVPLIPFPFFHPPNLFCPLPVSLPFSVHFLDLFPLTLVPGPLPSFRTISEVPCWLKHKSRLIRVQLAAARTSSGKH